MCSKTIEKNNDEVKANTLAQYVKKKILHGHHEMISTNVKK